MSSFILTQIFDRRKHNLSSIFSHYRFDILAEDNDYHDKQYVTHLAYDIVLGRVLVISFVPMFKNEIGSFIRSNIRKHSIAFYENPPRTFSPFYRVSFPISYFLTCNPVHIINSCFFHPYQRRFTLQFLNSQYLVSIWKDCHLEKHFH